MCLLLALMLDSLRMLLERARDSSDTYHLCVRFEG